MSSNRRSFLKKVGLGAGVIASAPLVSFTKINEESEYAHTKKSAERLPTMNFNMCGYAAPKLETVRIGFVGIGDRGSGAVERMTYIDGVEITAICDTRQAAMDGAQATLAKAGLPKAKEFTGSDTAFKKMCDSNLVDLVYIATPWEW
ncbi:MAG: twin-arginine translocation signal domain-containing protein, partial [Bacteroidales bacterium]|nr:twin-arginine translocation signal domain-containing protein [Bacteroidales bacterium]